jgi:hypothetical protein
MINIEEKIPVRNVLIPLHTGLSEKLEFPLASMLKLKLQDITAESMSLARVERMN